MIKIITVLGARPQFIKASVISNALKTTNGVSEILVHTGQHYDPNMSKIFFDELGIPKPKYNLGVGGGSHAEMTGNMLIAIEKVLFSEKPDYVLVYGDTNSTLAAALAASKMHIPLAHVEAGLRSFNRNMPEEINRVLTDHLSDKLFAPTKTAVTNLANEGIAGANVSLVGDVMYDAALFFAQKAESSSQIIKELNLAGSKFVLATIHRQENTENLNGLEIFFVAIRMLKMRVVMPIHPRTRKKLAEANFNFPSNLELIEPVGYLDMVQLEQHASVIVTDSGGVQKEAFFYKTPCLTLRDQTEWVELIDLGWNKLISLNDSEYIADSINGAIGSVGVDAQPYGEGNASGKIVEILLK